MSTVSVTNLKHASSASNNIVLDSSGNATFAGTAVPASSFLRNRIINGDMRIDQRNAGASVTPTADGTYTLDRWKTSLTQSSKFSVQQQTSVVPVGFTYALKITSLSAYSVGAGDTFSIYQVLEGFNVADLEWGTANAKTITLSFQVYSSLTGTFGGAIVAPSFGFSYPFSYSVPSANTWTTISVTIAGPTTGTFGTTNGNGFSVFFGLGSGATYSGTAGAWASSSALTATGATSVVGTNGATFYLTGVQLEVGTAATPFERRQYGQELMLCQRYYQTAGSGAFGSFDGTTSTTIQITEKLMPTMRTSPTASIRSGVNAAFRSAGTDFTATSPGLANYSANANAIGEGIAFWTQVTGFTGGTSNSVVSSRNQVSTNGGAFINLSAEL